MRSQPSSSDADVGGEESPGGLPLTVWLGRLRQGDPQALEHIVPLVYRELRALAGAHLRREDVGHTLGATALVHEVYLRLCDRQELNPRDRHHFFAIAARSMRQVLIDHARTRRRRKRGGGSVPLSLEDAGAVWAAERPDELLALDTALDHLAEVTPRAARVVESRFFGGLSLDETATSLGVSLKTVQRDWLLARAWLRREMNPREGLRPDGDGS